MRPAFHAAAAAFGPRAVKAVEVGVDRGTNADVALTEWPAHGALHLTLVEINPDLRPVIEESLTHHGADERWALLVGDSAEVAASFPDGHFDFVYIDDDHSLSGALRSIRAWLPKLRRGGILGGHDHAEIQEVRQAVEVAVREAGGILHVSEQDWWFVKV